jgi:hypothetical protein
VEAECVKKNQEWELWKRKYNITQWKPVKLSHCTPKKTAAGSTAAASPSSSSAKGVKKRGPKVGANKAAARLAKKGKERPIGLTSS